MSTELFYLTLSAGFCLIIWGPYIMARAKSWGLVDAVGYPDNPPDVPAWAVRLQRAHSNMIENLTPFAALVLTAHVVGVSNEMTVLGAALFFWGRVAHAVIYMLGIPWVRTASFAVSWVGMVLIFLQLVG